MPLRHEAWARPAWVRCRDNAGTMKVQLLSDLHLEVHPHFAPLPHPEADVLVLAGDIGSYQSGSLLSDQDFGLARFSPRSAGGHWPVPVIFVPGNHEYDQQDFDQAHARLRDACERLGLHWLERESLVLHGVRFAGSTRNGEPWLAEGVREQALRCQQWLRDTLHTPHAGPTVVVTHFAPSLLSADPRYGLTPGTAGFCNALDDLLPHASLWLHGHLHAPSDYTHQGCRVVANPLGYARKNEQQHFQQQHCVEVPWPADSKSA